MKRWLALALVVWLFTGQAAFAEQNLLLNPEIEQVTSNEQPEGWTREMWHYDAGVSDLGVRRNVYGSGYSLYVDNLGENDARFEQRVAVEPDTIYRISCMIRAEGCSEDEVGANLSIKDTFVTCENLYDTGGAFVKATLYGRTGPEQTEVTVMARVGGYGSLNIGRAWFDDFEMVTVDQVPVGAQTYSLSAVPPSDEGEGVDAQEDADAGMPVSGELILMIVGLAYALVCLIMMLRASRDKLTNRAGGPVKALLIGCAVALGVRVVIALMVRGYETDMNCFTAWAARMADGGPSRFYTPDVFCDYPPGYMYVLGLAGWVIRLFGLPLDGGGAWLVIKMVPICTDIFCALVVYRAAKTRLGESVAALLALMFAFNPAAILNSAAWGQVDAVLAALVAVSMLAAAQGRWFISLPVFCAAVLVKPQALMLAPLGLVMLVVEVIESERKWQMALKLLGAVAAGLALMLLIALPFMVNLPEALLPETASLQVFGQQVKFGVPGFLRPVAWLIGQYGGAMGSYGHMTVNACNLYALLGMNWMEMSATPSTAIFSWIMLAASYAYCAFLYVKAKDRGKIFVVCATLLTLVFALGPMMHERYLFPALLLLLLAYAFDRDMRLLFAFILLSFTQFTNAGLVLLNEHLVDANGAINAGIALINVLSASFMAWTAWEMCVAGRVVSVTRVYKPIVVKAQEAEKRQGAVADSLLRVRDARLSLKRKDWFFMITLTLLYAVVAFTNLGSLNAPKTQWQSTAAGEQVTFDLGEIQDFRMTYFGGICSSTFMVQLSQDGEVWSEAHYAEYDAGQIYKWMVYFPGEQDENGAYYRLTDEDYAQRARYVRLTSESAGLLINEVAFLDAEGKPLPVSSVYDLGGRADRAYDPKALIDEQYTAPAHPSYLTGMYFDEIYHARTAYEHQNGLHALEYTHPPLGKVLIMLGIDLFGMTPFGWRFMGALFGVLMVPLMYLLGKQLFKRSSLALIGAALLALDSMHFTLTRIATIDVFAVFFIMLMYLFMIRYALMSFYHTKLSKTLIPLGLSGVAMGLAIASKWTGIYGAVGLALIFFFTLYQRFREYRYAKANLRTLDVDQRRLAQRAIKTFWKSTLLTLAFCLVFFVAIPLLIYYFSYYWQLRPDGGLSLAGVWQTQRAMLDYHASISWNTHAFESPWYQWPLIVKPMWFYSGSEYLSPDRVSSISCMGNPVVWWGGLIAILYVMWKLATKCRGDRRYLFIVIGYLAEYVPWILVPRSTFIYHYFACVPFIILALVAVFEVVRKRSPYAYKLSAGIFVGAAAFLFIAFYPLMSGLPAPREYVKYLRWFNWYNY
ncbi:MAG: glycosyltransferase family 39 protein [Clostridia bacterium]